MLVVLNALNEHIAIDTNNLTDSLYTNVFNLLPQKVLHLSQCVKRFSTSYKQVDVFKINNGGS